MIDSALAGYLTGLGLIVAIGAQNVFVLRQGVARRHALVVAATASLTDAVLVTIGVAGVGTAIAASPVLAWAAGLGGALFLVGYGVVSLGAAFGPQAVDRVEGAEPVGSWRRAVAATLAISLLNPHVYLDTVVLLGGIGGRLPPDARLAFATGAVAASVTWFFALALGARALAPLFRRPLVARGLDLFVALVMFTVAGFLLLDLLRGA